MLGEVGKTDRAAQLASESFLLISPLRDSFLVALYDVILKFLQSALVGGPDGLRIDHFARVA